MKKKTLKKIIQLAREQTKDKKDMYTRMYRAFKKIYARLSWIEKTKFNKELLNEDTR